MHDIQPDMPPGGTQRVRDAEKVCVCVCVCARARTRTAALMRQH